MRHVNSWGLRTAVLASSRRYGDRAPECLVARRGDGLPPPSKRAQLAGPFPTYAQNPRKGAREIDRPAATYLLNAIFLRCVRPRSLLDIDNLDSGIRTSDWATPYVASPGRPRRHPSIAAHRPNAYQAHPRRGGHRRFPELLTARLTRRAVRWRFRADGAVGGLRAKAP